VLRPSGGETFGGETFGGETFGGCLRSIRNLSYEKLHHDRSGCPRVHFTQAVKTG
jgi:hypothetical protein